MSVDSLQQRIRRDAAWLIAGYAVTAGSGFLFWIVAALMVPSSQLGHDAAIISVFSAAAALSSTGVSTALVVMLPTAGHDAARLWTHARRVIVGASVLAGAIAGALVDHYALTGATLLENVTMMVVATVIWSLFNAQTHALTGLGDVPTTLWVNGPSNIAKLALTVLFAGSLAAWHPVVLATLAPAAVAVVATLLWLIPRATRRHLASCEPARESLTSLRRRFDRFSSVNALAIGVMLAVNLSIGFFVTVLSSPTQGALFAIAFQFGVALDLIAVGASTSLAKHTAGTRPDREVVQQLWRRVSLQVAAAGVAASALVFVMFMILGPNYPPVTGAAIVAMLATASLCRVMYDLWSAAVRAQHRVLPILLGNVACTALVAALIAILVPHGGAVGGAVAGLGGAALAGAIGAVGVRALPPAVTAP